MLHCIHSLLGTGPLAGGGEWCSPLVAAVKAPGNESTGGMRAGEGVDSTPSRCPPGLGRDPVLWLHRGWPLEPFGIAGRSCSRCSRRKGSFSQQFARWFAAGAGIVQNWSPRSVDAFRLRLLGGDQGAQAGVFRSGQKSPAGSSAEVNREACFRMPAFLFSGRHSTSLFQSDVAWATSGCFAGILRKNARV